MLTFAFMHRIILPCLHTFWHAIPTSFYIFNVFIFLLDCTVGLVLRSSSLAKWLGERVRDRVRVRVGLGTGNGLSFFFSSLFFCLFRCMVLNN